MNEGLQAILATIPDVQPAGTEAVPAPEAAAPATQAPQTPPAPKDAFASKFAALSRKEREFQQQRQKFEQERAAWLKERESQPKPDDYKARLTANPIKFMEEHGMTYEDFIKLGLNEGQPTPELLIRNATSELDKKYAAELAALKEQLQKREADEKERELNGVKQGFLDHITEFINTNEQEYEFVKANNAVEDVYAVCEEYYNRTGQNIDLAQAAREVESYYEKQAEKLLTVSKLKSKFGQLSQVEPKVAAPTLSNNQSTEVPVNPASQKLSRQEIIAESIRNMRS